MLRLRLRRLLWLLLRLLLLLLDRRLLCQSGRCPATRLRRLLQPRPGHALRLLARRPGTLHPCTPIVPGNHP